MAELEHRRQRRLRTERPLEPRAERQDVAARDWERTGIRMEPPHVPAVDRQIRAADRQAHRGIRQYTVADRTGGVSGQVVRAGRGEHQRTTEILSTTERPLDAEARATLTAGGHLLSTPDRRIARAVAVTRASADRPVGPQLERGRESGGHAAPRPEAGRREPQQVGRRRTKERNCRVGYRSRAGGNRPDDIEEKLSRNHPDRGADIGVHQAGVIDRLVVAQGRRCADERRAHVEYQAVAESLRDDHRDRELADLSERQSGVEAVGLERCAGAREGRCGLPVQHSRSDEQPGCNQERARARHGIGSLKMMRITVDAVTTLVMPWLSFVGWLATLVIPVAVNASAGLGETSVVDCCSAPTAAGSTGTVTSAAVAATATTSPADAWTAGAASAACCCCCAC